MIIYIIALSLGLVFFIQRAFKQIKQTKEENKQLKRALEALNRDLTSFQVGLSRDLILRTNEVDHELKVINKKVAHQRKDIINAMPDEIRKTIAHVEFARPLDNTYKS